MKSFVSIPLGRNSSETHSFNSVSFTKVMTFSDLGGRVRFASSHIGVKYHEKFAT